ncbi:MAG: inner membrane CreD family protein [Rhodanobacter sp.]
MSWTRTETAKVLGVGVLPLARGIEVRMRAPWRDPGFVGAGLPRRHQVSTARFRAHLYLLDLN